MSPPTALRRLAVRPLRGATLFDQLLPTAPSSSSSARSAFLKLPSSALRGTLPSSPCLRCLVQVRGRTRFYSTIPPQYPPTEGLAPKPSPNSESPQNEAEALPTPAEGAEPITDSASPPETSSTPSDAERSPFTSATEPPTESSKPPSDPQPETTPRTRIHLPSYISAQRHTLSHRFSTFMDDLQSRVLRATQTINDLTGYSAIEAIKARNTELESAHHAAQDRLRAARHAYKSLTSHRATTQREVTTLLARKDTWTPPDLERFTTLYRADHELEAQVANASAELTEAEAEEARVGAELNAGILRRYHEEQIWSDGIRRQSTWGTWGLMGVNVLLFLVLQFVAEPWRRARLVKGVAEREKEVMEEVRKELSEVRAVLEASGQREAERERIAELESAARRVAEEMARESKVEMVEEPVAQPPPPVTTGPVDEIFTRHWKEVVSDKELIKAAAKDLVSERRIDVRMKDVSMIALEGAAAGAALVGSIAVCLFYALR